MSQEELKRQVWVLTNEKNSLTQHNERLEQRLNEYVTWSEQAQKILDENKSKITQLEEQNRTLSSKVSEGTVAMSQTLLDENSSLKRKLQEVESHFEGLNEIVNPLIMKNLPNLDNSMKRKVKSVLSKGNDERRILALFIDDPSISKTSEEISRESGVSLFDSKTILKKFISEDFLREIKPGVYQTIHAVGDKIVSSKDLSRVSIDSLHDYIRTEISKLSDTQSQISMLEKYGAELSNRNESSLSSEIMGLIGDLKMARRSSDWIVEKLSEITSSNTHGESYRQPTPASNQFKPPSNAAKSAVNYQPTTSSVDKTGWENLSNSDVIERVKLQINERSEYNHVIDALSALRDYLETNVSGGRILYNLNSKINEIKKYKTFNKDDIHEILFELSLKV